MHFLRPKGQRYISAAIIDHMFMRLCQEAHITSPIVQTALKIRARARSNVALTGAPSDVASASCASAK